VKTLQICGFCGTERWSQACVGGADMTTNMSVYFV
jgi:hypothetical protein